MHKFLRWTAAVIAVAVVGAGSASAGTAPTKFKNETAQPVFVAIDTDREVHEVAPGATITFNEPNLFDVPTWHVYADDAGKRGKEVYSDKFSTIAFVIPKVNIPLIGDVPAGPPIPVFAGDLKWTGNKIERQ